MIDSEHYDDFHCLNCGHDVNDEFHNRLYEKFGSSGYNTTQMTLEGKRLRVWIHRSCMIKFNHPFLQAIITES